jgi:hypothetical protein
MFYFVLFEAVVLFLLLEKIGCQEESITDATTENKASRRIKKKRDSIESGAIIDKCAAQWREDSLLGRCFGIGPYYEIFPELKNRKVKNADICKKACCKLGPKCVTWQYGGGKNNSDCRMGGPVRFGDEGAGVAGWCEPNAPRIWKGTKISRDNGMCIATEELPGQCFGLGAEVMGVGGVRLSVEECKEKCCADEKCIKWQALNDRGCFMNSEDVWCDPTVQAYTGSRKCAKGFCGGKENILETIIYTGSL